MNENRKKLEDAAFNSAQRGGMNGLSFRTLADEVGIKSSSVHYYFPEKSDLTRTLIERYSENFFLSLQSIEEQNWALRKKLKTFIAIFESVATDNKLCLCGMMAAELEQLDEGNRALLVLFFEETEDWLAALFIQHKEEITTDVSARTLSRSLLSALEGALLLDRVVGDTGRLKAQKEMFLSLVK